MEPATSLTVMNQKCLLRVPIYCSCTFTIRSPEWWYRCWSFMLIGYSIHWCLLSTDYVLNVMSVILYKKCHIIYEPIQKWDKPVFQSDTNQAVICHRILVFSNGWKFLGRPLVGRNSAPWNYLCWITAQLIHRRTVWTIRMCKIR